MQGSWGLRKTASFAVILLLALGFLGTLESVQQAHATTNVTGIGSWTEQTDYGASGGSSGTGGTSILGNSCVTSAQTVYCVGGQNPQGKDLSNVYYASMTSSGTLGGWTETTDYGTASGDSGAGGLGIEFTSCVAYNGYIYCVGGATNSAVVSDSFYAQLSSSGVGPWTETTDYGAASGSSGSSGLKLFELSCIADSGYIYCLGGGTSKVFFAQLSSSGVGTWTETTDYGAASGNSGTGGVSISDNPNSCVDNNGSMYCVGGNIAFKPTSKVFYAQVSSTGVGGWAEAVDYGASSGNSGAGGVPIFATSCTDYSSAILCVGGDTTGPSATSSVFYGPVDQLSDWYSTISYVVATYHLSCAVLALLGLAWLFCTGGSSASTYSAPIQTPGSDNDATTTSFVNCYYNEYSTSPGDYHPYWGCGISVSGDPKDAYPTGKVTFATTGSGFFESSYTQYSLLTGCSLFVGSESGLAAGNSACSFYYEPGNGEFTATLTAAYQGDSDHQGSSASIVVSVGGSISTTTSPLGGLASTCPPPQTLICLSITGAEPSTAFTISSSALYSQPTGTAALNLNPTAMFDVKVPGITAGTADVCTNGIPVDSSTTMEYWNGGSWVRGTGTTETAGTPGSICTDIPVASLQGTPVIVGEPLSAGSTTSSTSATSTTAAQTSSSASSTASTTASTSTASSTSTTSSGGGIPEFPAQPLLVILLSAVMVCFYILSRSRLGKPPSKPSL